MKMFEKKSEGHRINSYENLSAEIVLMIFDYLTSIEILLAFFDLNSRFRSIVQHYFQADHRLTEVNLSDCPDSLYQRFCQMILPRFQSIVTSLELGSTYHYGQVERFQHYELTRLDDLTIHLIDSKKIIELLEKFLIFNRLQWFDKIHLILDEETQGWNDQLPFCVQNIPVRQLTISGKAPYVFAQHLMTGCYTITDVSIHLKYDHDLLPLLYYLPNLMKCNVSVDDRGHDISKAFSLLTSLPHLKYFKYQGLMPPMYLRRILLQINEHLEHLAISTQDYQWPFQPFDGFSRDFFEQLPDLKIFDFNIRLIASDVISKLPNSSIDVNYLIERNYSKNIAWTFSKEIGQIFSLPFAFDHLDIFDKDFFTQIHFVDSQSSTLNSTQYWSSVRHLTLHTNIYNSIFLKSIEEHFSRLNSIDYRVPHFSLNPRDHELDQAGTELRKIKKLIIRDSVKHGCHVPQPLILLTPNLVELDIDHFYLMQIISMVSQQTQTQVFSVFSRIRRLTVRQFDERVSNYFFSYFPQVKILALILTTYKMQIYRSTLPFLDPLLSSMPNLISLKFEHIKKPQEYQAFLELQANTNVKFFDYSEGTSYWSTWREDSSQKTKRYATYFWSK